MKHIGIHKDRKVAVIFRTVPGEKDNCLITYIDSLPEIPRNAINECLKSPDGQNAPAFSDAVYRFKTVIGDGLLNTLNVGNLMVKVPTVEVFLTPNDKSRVQLSELNAVVGTDEPQTPNPTNRDVRMPEMSVNNPSVPPSAGGSTPLSDDQIADSLRTQAATMQKEATRLLKEAEELKPLPKRGRGRPTKAPTPVA
jgi:hypothetical protein